MVFTIVSVCFWMVDVCGLRKIVLLNKFSRRPTRGPQVCGNILFVTKTGCV